MSDEVDPEIQKLLDELSSAQEVIPESKYEMDIPSHSPDAVVPELKAEDVDVEPVVETAPVVEPAPAQADLELEDRSTSNFINDRTDNVVTPDEIATPDNKIRNQLTELLGRFTDSNSRMLEEFSEDRKKCDDVFNILLPKIQSGQYTGQDAIAMVSLMQVKSDISGNRSRHMDSIAKLFSALKSNNVIGPVEKAKDGSFTQEELKKLLRPPVDD
jgi:hypothetical protein